MIIIQIGNYTITPEKSEDIIIVDADKSFSVDFDIADTNENRFACGITGIGQYDLGGLWTGQIEKSCIVYTETDSFVAKLVVENIDIEKGIHCYLKDLEVHNLQRTATEIAWEYRKFINLSTYPLLCDADYVNGTKESNFYDGARVRIDNANQPAFQTPLPSVAWNDCVDLIKKMGYTFDDEGFWRDEIWFMKPNQMFIDSRNKYRKIVACTQLNCDQIVGNGGKNTYIADGDYAGITDNRVSWTCTRCEYNANLSRLQMQYCLQDRFVVRSFTKELKLRLMYKIFGLTAYSSATFRVFVIAKINNQIISQTILPAPTVTLDENTMLNSITLSNVDEASNVDIAIYFSIDFPAVVSLPENFMDIYIQEYFDDEYDGYKQCYGWNDCLETTQNDFHINSHTYRSYDFSISNGINSQALGVLPVDYDRSFVRYYDEEAQAMVNSPTGELQSFSPLLCINTNIEDLLRAFLFSKHAATGLPTDPDKHLYIDTMTKTIYYTPAARFQTIIDNRLWSTVEIDKDYFAYPSWRDGCGMLKYLNNIPYEKVDDKKNILIDVGTTLIRDAEGLLHVTNNRSWFVGNLVYDISTDLHMFVSSRHRDASTINLSSDQSWGDERYNFLFGDVTSYKYTSYNNATNVQNKGVVAFFANTDGCPLFYTRAEDGIHEELYYGHWHQLRIAIPPIPKPQIFTFHLPQPILTKYVNIKSNSFMLLEQEFGEGDCEARLALILD